MRTLHLALAAALAGLLALPAPGSAQDAAANSRPSAGLFPQAPTVERLQNGLTVVSVPWESPGIIAYFTLVRVGARDEVEQGRSGFAHLFEHMMFRGTQNVSQAQYEAALQAVGADNNAYTTQDFTLYTLTGPSSALGRLAELEADRFQHLSYTEEVFRTETGAVRGEYSVNASNPFLKMWEALSEISSAATPTATPPWATWPTSSGCPPSTSTRAASSGASTRRTTARSSSPARWTTPS